jgi:hypothetical protein
MGTHHPRVAPTLEAHGLSEAVIDEGWRLLRALTESRSPRQHAHPRTDTAELIAALDAWENRWLPIARASLRRHESKAHDWLFQGLSMQDGVAVVLSVDLFVSRVRQLEKGVQPLGAAAPRARSLLEERGLDEEALAVAEHLLRRVTTVADGQPLLTGPTPEQQQAAEDALWGWYLEWAAVARAVVRDGNLLRALGFGARRRRAVQGEDEADVDVQERSPAQA